MKQPQNKLSAHESIPDTHTTAERQALDKIREKQDADIAQFLLTPRGMAVDIFAKGRNLAALIDDHIDSLASRFVKQIQPLRKALALLRRIERRGAQKGQFDAEQFKASVERLLFYSLPKGKLASEKAIAKALDPPISDGDLRRKLRRCEPPMTFKKLKKQVQESLQKNSGH
jgi:hypothetical protein